MSNPMRRQGAVVGVAAATFSRAGLARPNVLGAGGRVRIPGRHRRNAQGAAAHACPLRRSAPRCAAYAVLLAVSAALLGGCAQDISGGNKDKEPKGVTLVLQSKDPASVERPAWIDADTIIFSWNQDTSTKQLWTVKLSGGKPTRFVEDNANDYVHPAYSPNVASVAFEVIENQFAGSGIDAKLVDGSIRTSYVAGADFSATYPCWGPGGKSIGYLKTGESEASFVMVELDKAFSPPRPLTNTAQFALDRAFQPTRMAWYAPASGGIFSGKVAYNRIPPKAQGGTEIYYHDLDSGKEVRLTDESTPDASANVNPSWSPDGKYIVYSSDFRTTGRPEFRRELFVVSVESKAAARLTVTGDDEKDPAWSPDGALIAYVSDGNLYVLAVDQKVLP